MQSTLEQNPLADYTFKYEKVQTLGQGSFGFVQLAKNPAGELAAIKVRCRDALDDDESLLTTAPRPLGSS